MLKTWIKRSLIVGMGFGLLAPVVSHAYGEASVIQNYVGRQALVPLIKPSWGNFILHSDTLNKLYSLRGYEAIWVDSNGAPTAMAQALRSILLTADRHGLNVSDYWDGDVENLYKAALSNPRNWITFELAASEALIRYVTHLSVGRFDPMQIDDDIKFSAKIFKEFAELNTAVSYGPQSMPDALENFAPKYHYHYANLMGMLAKLRTVKAQGSWAQIPQSKVTLEKNVKNPLVLTLRTRLTELGYKGGNLTSDIYDSELEAVVFEFQEYNGLFADGKISAGSSGTINALNTDVNELINKVIINMEKLRWLPRDMEARHIFVNLAMTEVGVYDVGRDIEDPILTFNSVNGQPFRRTPSMRDVIKHVNINPYWTAPRSITIKDKLQELRTYGKRYLDEHDMVLMSENTGAPVPERDLYYIDWKNLTPKNFNYYIKQNPSVKNALGVVKFPLQNPWAIYLHDTNDPDLFRNKYQDRHKSSGCVRLEEAVNLADYLISGKIYGEGKEPKIRWEDLDKTDWSQKSVRSFIPRDGYNVADYKYWDMSVYLKNPMPVYMLYLSAMSSGTKMRFVDDPYGQDKRIELAIKNYRAKGELF
ncbi:hypothetical protein AZI86_18165 [Bdellovibrio bacteriovorus]|uniref:Amidase n=1 Tax=Bdellovibrio bacteriovorus TaxID=959 RepID=A0A150WES4_BDEBC|nr:L,D-transpeptidase family protein [Bdellovibrio bacteriovorus]KYG61628.1 hypothetical protein AZI86_18165 [Bdellovibrio bacteriovorus]